MKTSAAEVIALARSQKGILESPPNSNDCKFTRWHGHVGWAWCNIFVDWVLAVACGQNGEASPLAGIDFPGGPAYTGDTMTAGERGINGLGWSANPVLGSLAIYDWDWRGMTDHIGIVSQVHSNSAFAAVEGNTSSGSGGSQSDGGGVFERERSNICGYVRGFVTLPYGKGGTPIPSIPGWPGIVLALTSPLMGVPGNNNAYLEIRQWQQRMWDRGWHTLPDLSGIPGKAGELIRYTLGRAGYRAGQPFKVNGVYDASSAAVCAAFQHEKGLGVDCQVGPVTWTACFRPDNVTP
jgi:hypothetical protein